MNQSHKASKKYHIFFRLRIFDEEEHFVGKGRVELLELIREHGSINKAAAEMKMSYRQAWQMVEEMNLIADAPLVEKVHGGKSGGGTKVTPTGEKVIQVYHEILEEMENFTAQIAKKIKF